MEIITDFLDPHQYGSLQGNSAVHALVELTHNWLASLEEHGKAVRILLLDFRKAFDRVDHNILLSKLTHAGIPEFIVHWVAAFLHQRKQRVKIGTDRSDWLQLNGGVPQGTLLGPICFLLHISDLKTCCADVKYADDSTI